MPLLKTPREKATKPHNDYISDSEDKITTSKEHPRPKHDKPDVAHHFLNFYFDDESESTLYGTTDVSTKYHVFKDALKKFDKTTVN